MPESPRVEELRRRHAALSAKVESIQLRPSTDDLEVVALKKQKLRLKEEITRLSAM
ncbi:YdcH family protein [Tropicimonas sp. IMCC34043]|uniref:YdcH family protein n=1 Tax=Tropicimonas sp. IMCC34043 TaxID=2248760 RepID=UPI000E279C6A|nr:YdcH family protein [Tropicimonas sp. IMCC34043]